MVLSYGDYTNPVVCTARHTIPISGWTTKYKETINTNILSAWSWWFGGGNASLRTWYNCCTSYPYTYNPWTISAAIYKKLLQNFPADPINDRQA